MINATINDLPKDEQVTVKKSSRFVLGRLGWSQRYRKQQFVALAKEMLSSNEPDLDGLKLLASSLKTDTLMQALRESATGDGFVDNILTPALEANKNYRQDSHLFALTGQILYDAALSEGEETKLVHATIGRYKGKTVNSFAFSSLIRELRNRVPRDSINTLLGEYNFMISNGTDEKSAYAKSKLFKYSARKDRNIILKKTFGPHYYDNKNKLLSNLQGISRTRPTLDKEDMKYLLDNKLISQELYDAFLPSTEHLPKYIIPQLKVAQTQNERNALLDKAFAGYSGNAIGDQLAEFLGESKEELSLTVEDLKYLHSQDKISAVGVEKLTEIFNNPPEDPTEYYNALVQAYKDIYPGR